MLCTLMADVTARTLCRPSVTAMKTTAAPDAPGGPSPHTGISLQALPLACCMPSRLRSSWFIAFGPVHVIWTKCFSAAWLARQGASARPSWAHRSALDRPMLATSFSKAFWCYVYEGPCGMVTRAVFSRVEWSRLRQAFQPADGPRTRPSPNQRCIASATCTSQPL